MARTFYITSRPNRMINIPAIEGDAQTIQLDFSAWAEDNAAVSAVTWTVDSGDAAVSGAALASNVASALITTANIGNSMIKVSATDGTRTRVVYIRVKAKKPYSLVDDYGLCA